MNRHAMTAMIATVTLVVGCARTRASLPPNQAAILPPAPTPGPVELKTEEPIRASINQGKIPTDLNTVRASYTVEEAADEPPSMDAPKAETAKAARPSTPPPSEPVAPPVIAKPREAANASVPKPAPGEATVKAPAESTGPTLSAKGSDAIRLKTDPGIEPGKRAARTAAMVGGTVITLRELKAAVCSRFEIPPHELRQVPDDQLNMMAKSTLDGLIDNALLLQEAQRDMKKNWKTFTDYAEKSWKEKEVPRKLRKYGAEDEFTLRRKMEERGESLDDVKDMYKQESMARDFLMIRLQPKVDKPGKPEMEAYYAEHRKEPRFHREAKVYWHEILIPVALPTDLPKARKTAEEVRAKLLKGEDFATLAKSTSHGATAAKGGAWETEPGGHPVPAINAALGSLKPGDVAAPIVGPKGVHIVRVDRRTTSGPAPFVEVQKQIAEALFQQRFSAIVDAYLKKLRDKTTITSPMFENTSTAPTVVQEQAKQDTSARRTAGP